MNPATLFKSIGFTGVSQTLGGVFVGQDEAEAAAVGEQWPSAMGGGLIVIMDIGLFTSAQVFRKGVDKLSRGVRQTMAPLRGYDEANLPGTPEARKEEAYGRDGIVMGTEDVEQLRQTAIGLGVEVPEALR